MTDAGELDRSKRPRKPRRRVDQRRVAALGFQPQFEVVEQDVLNEDQLDKIALPLSKIIDRQWLDKALQEITGIYLRRLTQPQPSKNETRFQLEMIAHLTWKMNRPGANLDALAVEVRGLERVLNFEARAYMWGGIDSQIGSSSINLESTLCNSTDFAMLGNAAASAISRLPNAGDYGDHSVFSMMSLLVYTYETVTGRTATFSRAPFGETNSEGSFSTQAGSQCGRFVLAFFDCVDLPVGTTKLTNALEKFLHARRKHALNLPIRLDRTKSQVS